MDITVKKPLKDRLRKSFQTWYASEIQKQLKDVSLDKVKVDIHASTVKPMCSRWIKSAWQDLQDQPSIAINGFRNAEILDAITNEEDQ